MPAAPGVEAGAAGCQEVHPSRLGGKEVPNVRDHTYHPFGDPANRVTFALRFRGFASRPHGRFAFVGGEWLPSLPIIDRLSKGYHCGNYGIPRSPAESASGISAWRPGI